MFQGISSGPLKKDVNKRLGIAKVQCLAGELDFKRCMWLEMSLSKVSLYWYFNIVGML